MKADTGKRLFIGSYAAKDQPGIYSCEFDEGRGEITQKSAFTGITNPSFLTLHPNGRWLYSVSEMGMASDDMHGEVWAFEIDAGSGELRPINKQSAKGDWPCHVVIDHTGRWLVASNYGSGNAALYPISAEGGIGPISALVQHMGSGPNKARQEGPHAHSAVFTPDNRFVIVADLGIDQLVIYNFDADAGTLTEHGRVATKPGAGPRHFAFHPDGEVLYVANELDSSVTVYAFSAEACTLTPKQTLPTLATPDPDSTVADIHLSTSGDRLYISNRGLNSVATFAVDPEGRLRSLSMPSCGGNWPRNFALAPGGQHMLVANRRSNQVSILPLDQVGGVGEATGQFVVEEPSCLCFSAETPPI